MRWSRAASPAAAAAWAALTALSTVAALSVAAAPPDANEGRTRVDVMAVSFEEFGATGAALGEVLVGVLAARGVPARRVPPGAECATPDSSGCLRSALAALARGALAVAVVPAARVPPAPVLRDAGLEELGEVAPASRRSCRATGGALRSLAELADPARAATYALSTGDLRTALALAPAPAPADTDPRPPRYYCANGTILSFPESCGESEYATMLTGTESEAGVAAEVVRQHGLRAHVLALGTPAPAVAAALRPQAALLCGRALPAGGAGRALGPPPCPPDAAVCPFDSRRLVKLVNMRVLAAAPSAVRALTRLELDGRSLRELAQRAAEAGPEGAAREAAAAHASWAGAAGEVRAAVMVPLATAREAYDAPALRAAAELAELDSARPRGYLNGDGDDAAHHTGLATLTQSTAAAAAAAAVTFKVELLDDGCTATRAFKYLTDALGTEFGALSGVVGPACGGAFGDVTRQSPALALPVLAYTAQAPPAGAAAPLTLLAAGDARRATGAWAALMARAGWRRAAVLSELATRAALDVARLGVDVLAHLELPGDGDTLDDIDTLLRQWAERVVAANGRIIYVCVEDARAVRAALCAGRRAGLAPADGAVWLLPGALPAGWLRPTRADRHGCTPAQLADMAEGHLTVTPEWAVRWGSGAGAPAWRRRWRARCGPACPPPPPYAALLYDVLRLWADALARLLRSRPAALDDLHRDDLVRSLIADVTSREYAGLTGEFTWQGGARAAALVVQQWRNGTHVPVGTWRGESDALALLPGEPRWRAGAGGGAPPDDGGERCALRALADALNVECRVAFAAIGALVLAALLTMLTGAAWHCRRRAEREFRARLVALDMRTLGPKFGGLDRWEVPRERVVINRKLGTGAFGTVYGGHALLPSGGGGGGRARAGAVRAEERGWAAVAVKTLKAGATTDEKLDFLSEAEAMKRFDHKNVVRLLGVVTKTEPVCTVMEYMLYGDLKNYLVARRQLAGAGGAAGAEVSPARLTAMALDVARALSYLAQLRYVHRDVAARNCLVSATRVVKLADFGMTRLVFENDYYRFSRKGMLPVRWMAPESLALGVFSPASDVWSFGVLLYEIVTFGSLPFQGLGNSEVLERVKAGHTLDLPPGLKPQLEGLIKSCWQRERRARPKAAAVAAFLAESPRLLAPCLDVPLDALPLALEAATPAPRDAEARWVSWAAPTSAGTDSTYLSADGGRECDAFLPAPTASDGA